MAFEKICILGMGYIGLPTACFFASRGIHVVGVDINQDILQTLAAGRIHIHEPGLLAMVQQVIQSGFLTVSSHPVEADAYIIAVPTPFYDGKKADLRAVKSATEALVPCIRPGALVVLESTSPPRTTLDIVAPILEKSGLQAGKDFFVAYSPERVLPGRILLELVENDRVMGGITPDSAKLGAELYAVFVKGQIFQTDSTTAEMVKLMENTYRDVNIAIANEFSRLADRFGVNVWEAISLANRHPRVKILNPGPGVGGHCISVDPWFFIEQAPDLTKLILAARQVNDSQPEYVCHLVAKALGGLKDRKIAVLGLSYKPDIDDLRESPAVEIADSLSRSGAFVTAYEPYKPDASFAHFKTVPSFEEAVHFADAILLLDGHAEFRRLTSEQILKISPARVVIDTTSFWADYHWEALGAKYLLLGNVNRLSENENHENLVGN